MVNAQSHPARPRPSKSLFCRYDNPLIFVPQTIIGPPARHPSYGDVVIVCVDCEGWQSNSRIRTSEFGVTLVDTRDLHDAPVIVWKNHIHSFHLRTVELMGNRPAHWAKKKCSPDNFHWEISQTLPVKLDSMRKHLSTHSITTADMDAICHQAIGQQDINNGHMASCESS